MKEEQKGELILYQTEDGTTKIEVRLENETVWLTQAQLVELYQSSKSNISEHIKHIFEEGELIEDSVVRKFRTTAADDKDYNTTFFNLDMIISLGYRIKSRIATKFRIWATERLKEYIIKGFTMDDERLSFSKLFRINCTMPLMVIQPLKLSSVGLIRISTLWV
jgi:hypothetical protein